MYGKHGAELSWHCCNVGLRAWGVSLLRARHGVPWRQVSVRRNAFYWEGACADLHVWYIVRTWDEISDLYNSL